MRQYAAVNITSPKEDKGDKHAKDRSKAQLEHSPRYAGKDDRRRPDCREIGLRRSLMRNDEFVEMMQVSYAEQQRSLPYDFSRGCLETC